MHRPQPSSTLFPYTTLFRSWGVWSFSKNIPAAKALLTHLCQRSSVEQTVAASHGYDIPQFAKLHDFKTWAIEEPPKGTIYNYPPRGDVQVVIPYGESPTKIANQIYAQATLPKIWFAIFGGDSP